jgi:hypothetical protein
MTFTPVIWVSIALAASMAGNAALTAAYLGQRDETTEARGDRDRAQADAKACSDGVLSLQAAAEQRAKDAEKERDAATAKQKQAQATAAELMRRKPSVPADSCASAKAQIDDWLSSRRAK